ncbi:hypothetical protein OS493_024302 [Desmophyllum pertusum]|uniref:Uncharacterized protein n=1 Tax=Desmophyllum pertusum TaxID=174260 RepID=A0A9X0CQ70_9CNID|nr:hypothetical protein OS493_024302 [Desmophyllum pertusum]
MEKNAQHMAQNAGNVSSTIIGSKCAEISKHRIDKADSHPNHNLMAENTKTRQSRASESGYWSTREHSAIKNLWKNVSRLPGQEQFPDRHNPEPTKLTAYNVEGAQEKHDVLQLVPEIASLLCSRVLLCKYRKVEKSEIDRKEVLLPCATDKSDLLQSYLNTQVSSVIDANSLQTQKTNVGSMAEPLMAIPKIEHKTKLQSLQIYLDPSSKISKVVIIPLPSTLNPFAPEYINFSTPKNQTPTRPYTMHREEVGRNSTNTAPVQSGNSPS